MKFVSLFKNISVFIIKMKSIEIIYYKFNRKAAKIFNIINISQIILNPLLSYPKKIQL